MIKRQSITTFTNTNIFTSLVWKCRVQNTASGGETCALAINKIKSEEVFSQTKETHLLYLGAMNDV